MKFKNNYSLLDKLLHRLSFRTTSFQMYLSELEDDMYGKKINSIQLKQPVFILSLPRAGTTLLLDLCTINSEFITHTYRNMPFVFLPILWKKFSSMFQSTTKLSIERAHDDGMKISLDTAEAFEETLWHAYWKEKYQHDYISHWNDENQNSGFNKLYKNHIKKILLANNQSEVKFPRYISKNNANIVRYNYLSELFSDGIFIVLFRNPLSHARSLQNQHLGFVEMHTRDSFSHEYMRGIGHYDFGKSFKPLNINNWYSDGNLQYPETSLEFWLIYWSSIYEDILNRDIGNCVYFSYDRLCSSPEHSLKQLAESLQIENSESLLNQKHKLSASENAIGLECDRSILTHANSIFNDLNLKSIN